MVNRSNIKTYPQQYSIRIHEKIPLRHHSPRESYQKRKVFVCLQKDSKDGASLASCGREFQSLGVATEKALSCVPTRDGYNVALLH